MEARSPGENIEPSGQWRLCGHIRLSLHPLDVLDRSRNASPNHIAAEVALADQGICLPERFQTSGIAMFAKEFVGEAVEVGAGRNCHAARVGDKGLTEV
jgi:hypothetical protein